MNDMRYAARGRKPNRRNLPSKYEVVIGILCFLVGIIFSVITVIKPVSPENILFFGFGYVGLLVPLVAFASGAFIFLGKTRTTTKRAIFWMVMALIILSNSISNIELLSVSLKHPGSITGATGGMVGLLFFSVFKLFFSLDLAIICNMMLTSFILAIFFGTRFRELANKLMPRLRGLKPNLSTRKVVDGQ